MLSSIFLSCDLIASASMSYFLLHLLVTSCRHGIGGSVSPLMVQNLAQCVDMKLFVCLFVLFVFISHYILIEIQVEYLQKFKEESCVLMRQNLELSTVVLY